MRVSSTTTGLPEGRCSASPLVNAFGFLARLGLRAAEALAFKVLQETLISPEEGGSVYAAPYPSAIDQALARLTGGSRSRSGSVSSSYGGQRRSRPEGAASHVRSKSRSQLYRRHGAGKMESELDEETSGARRAPRRRDETRGRSVRGEGLRGEGAFHVGVLAGRGYGVLVARISAREQGWGAGERR
ncbi:hypothetical protein NUW54_g1603 [Trametes sanguinea]|uniref:Uncharacterized protein n=1 Tax=Trametes sanguinea TaxID=158606 RepID=A0ACC1Q5V3_9APHY|nr:hypothetical protein NUW54_g1603 [Trametes sanguinea]